MQKTFFKETWDFINGGLENGENVMVHCLAGAHRAGATTVASVMKKMDMPLEEALKYSKEKRRIISPFGSGMRFLRKLNAEIEVSKLQKNEKETKPEQQ